MQASQRLEVGAIVHLNSGSPQLYVRRDLGDTVEVEWLGDDWTFTSTVYPKSSLYVDKRADAMMQ